jgi:hypothetical protein
MLVPVPIVWSYNCREAYVTGDFNDFGLYELSGNAEKCTVIWVSPGLLFYRFLIDGHYTYDPEKPTENIDGQIYNVHYVESLPSPLGDLYHMSIHDIEEIDKRISLDMESESEDSLSDTSEHASVRSICNYDFYIRRLEEMPQKMQEQTNGFRGWITQLIRKVL